ncbi:hypothetical protein QUB80_15595 [Chlorogloeopsis sp. ULAP01]|uniref:hypothetical protein n=1 Tax=Chlorogloeopsis sp. ULAP01 TaxID=3056483 RepID=UPI0025AB2503|nr:hypothetical protein [Chlorogloeopsis sp. ULAP01]MDM9382126.1 hypothetical protein [Chlorogloeopsis sp. ULAP01]
MSYYNFDEHFWSAQTVCSKKALPKPNPKIARISNINVLKVILTLGCIGIWTPLLLQFLVPVINQNQEESSLYVDNSGAHRLLLKRAIILNNQ